MRNLLISISITFVTIFGGAFIVYNYVPLDWITASNNTGDFGAITTLVGTENLSDFPTTYNANLAQLMRMSTTTLPTLVGVGTITTGVWNGTAINVANGGTGATSLTDNGVLVGSGTSAFTALSVGTNGQLLIGDTSDDPVFATLNCDRSLTCTTGAGTLEIDVDAELYTESASANLHATSSNLIATSTETLLAKKFHQGATLTAVHCKTFGIGTSTIDVKINGTTSVFGDTPLTCGTDGDGSSSLSREVSSTTISITAMAANDYLEISVADAEPTGNRPRSIVVTPIWTWND